MPDRGCNIWSLVVLSVLEMGLGASSIALGVFGIIRVRSVHKLQLGDASPIWSGICVSQIIRFCSIITSMVNRNGRV